ncbi:MAG TPA: glycosyltransferase family 2 protein [Anaerolineaceae bacterium]|nr:glycosyltransferase family 2 protein [Anaerolineaceae bacterium]HPN51805.1 glycosyltransferase family 2 protein [Anaerolineaceae bacterium]
MTLSVIVPAYNEEKTIEKVLQALQEKVPQVTEIIVVDDGSRDQTAALVEKAAAADGRIRLIRQPQNQGKTAALRTGFAASTGDIVIVQDADLEYDPADIQHVIDPILEDKADVVFGSRFLVRRAARILYFRHYMANRFLTFCSNLLTDINFSDVETCYKAFRGDIIRKMIITSSGFGFEIEVTAKIAKLGCRVYEVPISYYGRTYQEGKKIGWKDGFDALYYILKFNWFCSLKDSFTSQPVLLSSQNQN